MNVRAAALLVLCMACGRMHRSSAEPFIEFIKPDSVMLASGAVVEVVVRGRGFAPGTPGRNTIQFAGVTITNVPASADGTEIRVVIPDRVPVRGDAAPLPLEAGRYDLRVQTSAGTSKTPWARITNAMAIAVRATTCRMTVGRSSMRTKASAQNKNAG